MAGSEHEPVADPDDRVAVTAGGVHVNKWVAESGSKVPIIKYELASTRSDDVRVALTDRIPGHLDLEDFGFHDEFHGDDWTHTDSHTIRFETELPAGETLTTVYGVRRESITDPSDFLGRPEMSISSSSNAEPDTDAASGSEDVPDAESTVDDEPVDAAASDVPTLSLPDPASSEDDAEGGVDDERNGDDGWNGDGMRTEDGDGGRADHAVPVDDETDETDGVQGASTKVTAFKSEDGGDIASERADGANTDATAPSRAEGASEERIVERFVDALQSGSTSPETRAALGRELNLQLSASSSQFVEHLQSRVKEKRGQLEGDIEHLEDSIAELYGVKADASTVASVRNEKADRETVSDVSAAVDELADEKADESDVASVSGALAELESDAATESELAATAERLEERIEALDDDVDALDDRAATTSDLAALGETVDELDDDTPTAEAFEALQDEHQGLAADAARKSAVESLEADLEATESALESTVDERANALEDRLDEDVDWLESRLTELNEETATEASLAATDERVDELADSKAAADDLERVEADLEAEYVTEADITDAVESRLQRSLFARTLLLGAGLSAGAGFALVATGITAGAALAVLGLAVFAYWWWLNESELDSPTEFQLTRGVDGDADSDRTTSDDEATGDDEATSDGGTESGADEVDTAATEDDAGSDERETEATEDEQTVDGADTADEATADDGGESEQAGTADD